MIVCAVQSDVQMIRCSNIECNLGTWFHVDCVGLANIPDGDWWCSSECRHTERSIYCFCKEVRTGEQVKCANDDCANGSTFHLTCVHLQQKPKQVTKWLIIAARRRNMPSLTHTRYQTTQGGTTESTVSRLSTTCRSSFLW